MTSTTLQQDKKSFRQVVTASMVGTVAEWYEFFIYGIASSLVFGKIFFPNANSVLDGILIAFGTYAIGFLARPIGGIVFGHFGDKLGRKRLLQISIIMMGVSTFSMGLLPGYATIGYAAPIMLVILRFMQGFAVGGEWGGAVLLITEHSPEDRRGFWASFPQAAACMGNLIASLVLFGMTVVLSEEAFLAWGWRVAFWLSALIIFLAYYIRRNIQDAPIFQEAQKKIKQNKEKSGIKELLTSFPREALLTVTMRMAENAVYYIIVVFTITYLSVVQKVEFSSILWLLAIANAFQFFSMIFSGYLADQFGRKNTIIFGYVGLLIWVFFYFPGLNSDNFAIYILAMCSGLFLQGCCYAPQAAFLSEIFPTRVRYTGSSWAYQIASIFGGSLAPIIAVFLLKTYGGTTQIVIYLVVLIIISLLSVLMFKETKGISLYDVDEEHRAYQS